MEFEGDKFTTFLQWPNLPSQPYPLAPYGGLHTSGTGLDPQHNFFADSAHTSYRDRPSSRSRSTPGSFPKGTRGDSSARGRSKGKRKEQTTTLDSMGNPYTAVPLSLSQPSRSIPRSGGSRKAKPYDNPDHALELKKFNDIIWDLAKRWFVLKLWRESCFFYKAEEKKATVDRCATEAYEAAIREYTDSNPNAAALVTKFRLQPQETDAMVQCHEVVRGCYHKLNGFSLIKFILVTACRSFVSRNCP